MKKIKILYLIFIPFLYLFSGEETEKMGVVIKSVENMHSRPDEMADVVSQAVIGTNVKIIKSENNEKGEEWFLIETPDTYQGWMKASSIRVFEKEERLYAREGKVFEVKSLIAYIYRDENVTTHKPLTFAPIGSILEAGNWGERWCEINLPSGEKGWIQKGDGIIKDASQKKRRITSDEMINLAKRFLGIPYLWGGTTPIGLDCSGFTQLICRLSGIEVLRDANIQFERSGLMEVPKGKERKGDLVFFGKSIDKITHVGIMISRKEFIHSTTHEKPVVQISRLSDPYWKSLYQGARRPF
ncbi:MAG: SH3 domain-containing C40 family peptidase [Acidobacteriota bacterium]